MKKAIILLICFCFINSTLNVKASNILSIQDTYLIDEGNQIRLNIVIQVKQELGALKVMIAPDDRYDVNDIACKSNCQNSYNHQMRSLLIYPIDQELSINHSFELSLLVSLYDKDIESLIINLIEIHSSDTEGKRLTYHDDLELYLKLSEIDHVIDQDEQDIPNTNDKKLSFFAFLWLMIGLLIILVSKNYNKI